MDICFGDDETAELCSRAEKLTARWGPTGGRAVGRKLLQIEAAPTVEALQALPGVRRDPVNDTWMISIDSVAIIKFELDTGPAGGMRMAHVLTVTDQLSGRTRR